MKIGIITFHRALNYGAVLQCYALYKVIKEQNHDVEVIDYRSPGIEDQRMMFQKIDFRKRKGFVSKIKGLLYYPLSFYKRRKAIKVFEAFLQNHLKQSNAVLSKDDFSKDYDCIVFGSDQIWSPGINDGFDNIYWGQFLPQIKKITYAASIGGHNVLSETHWDTIKTYLPAYTSLSVREQALQKDLLEKTGTNSQLVVDPVLLAGRTIFDDIAVKPKEKEYVLLFTLENDPLAIPFAKRIAKALGCQVLKIISTGKSKTEDGVITKASITPAEFLGFFKYAKFIVSISFHGTAFSVLFNKNFYSLHCQQEDRAKNLLKSVGLESQMVYSNENAAPCVIDYDMPNQKLMQLRKESLKVLCSFING